MFLQILLSLGVAYLTWSFIALEMNMRRASAMGIPLIRLPVDPKNVLWLVLEPQLWHLLDRLPFDWGTFRRYSRRGWYWQDKAKSHLQYGPVWGLVTPQDIYVHIADPLAVTDIFHRRGDFLRPTNLYSKYLNEQGQRFGLTCLQRCLKFMVLAYNSKLERLASAQENHRGAF